MRQLFCYGLALEQVPEFCAPTEEYPEGIAPFKVPYATMLPKRGEVDNLLVPVAISASHIAFNSIRMEPTWVGRSTLLSFRVCLS